MDISQLMRILDLATEFEDAFDRTTLQVNAMGLPRHPDTKQRNNCEKRPQTYPRTKRFQLSVH
jgi:hypothetical protein